MKCPSCGELCVLLAQCTDEFGVVREWCCPNENCMWMEGDPPEDDESESSET